MSILREAIWVPTRVQILITLESTEQLITLKWGRRNILSKEISLSWALNLIRWSILSYSMHNISISSRSFIFLLGWVIIYDLWVLSRPARSTETSKLDSRVAGIEEVLPLAGENYESLLFCSLNSSLRDSFLALLMWRWSMVSTSWYLRSMILTFNRLISYSWVLNTPFP